MCRKFFSWKTRAHFCFIVRAFCRCVTRGGWKMRAESVTVGINNFISAARHYRVRRKRMRRGRESLFLRDLDRKDDSCAIAHDFLRVPPFSSISSACLSYLSPSSSLIPVSYSSLTPLSLSIVLPFLHDEFNSCRRSVGRTLNLPRLLPTPGSIRISISMRRHPAKAFVLLLSISRVPRVVFVRRRMRPCMWFEEPRMENASPYQSLPPDRAAAGSRELSSEHEDNDDQDGSWKIDRFFPLPALFDITIMK